MGISSFITILERFWGNPAGGKIESLYEVPDFSIHISVITSDEIELIQVQE